MIYLFIQFSDSIVHYVGIYKRYSIRMCLIYTSHKYNVMLSATMKYKTTWNKVSVWCVMYIMPYTGGKGPSVTGRGTHSAKRIKWIHWSVLNDGESEKHMITIWLIPDWFTSIRTLNDIILNSVSE